MLVIPVTDMVTSTRRLGNLAVMDRQPGAALHCSAAVPYKAAAIQKPRKIRVP